MHLKSDNFESKLESAKVTLDKLMNPEITLEESMTAYKDGMKELNDAQKLLEKAQESMAKIAGKS